MTRNHRSVSRIRRPNGFRFQIDFTYLDAQARRRRYRRDASVQTMLGARAEAARLQMLAATTGRVESKKQVPTFTSFARGQFTELFMPKYRLSTRNRYQQLLADLIARVGSKRLDEIGAADARALAAYLMQREIAVKPHVNMLKTVLRAAHEVGALDEAPKFPKLFGESRKLPSCPSKNEVERMLARANAWLRVAVALGAYAGLRLGEVRALEVRDIDFSDNVIRVRHALSESELSTPKSGHERVVPMTDALRSILQDAVQLKLSRARVVVTQAGTTPRRTLVLRKFKAMQRRSELPSWSFHSLRHHFISELVRNGASIEVVRLLAGHSKLDVTQRYVHARAQDIHQAVKTLTQMERFPLART